jgi:hypothetical protein
MRMTRKVECHSIDEAHSCVWRIADSGKISNSPHTGQCKNDHAFRIAAFAPRSTTSPCATVSRSKSHSRMPASAASANRRRILISKRNVLGMARPPNPPSSLSTIRVSASSEWFTLNIRSVNHAVRLRRSKNIVSLRGPIHGTRSDRFDHSTSAAGRSQDRVEVKVAPLGIETGGSINFRVGVILRIVRDK